MKALLSAWIQPAPSQVLTGTHSHGQGHDTTFAQLVCDKLGVDIEAVEIVHGDSDRTAFGMGTYGSRSLAGWRNSRYQKPWIR
jgi:CO/xanthine dehydrogenase Mo-binding subunit